MLIILQSSLTIIWILPTFLKDCPEPGVGEVNQASSGFRLFSFSLSVHWTTRLLRPPKYCQLSDHGNQTRVARATTWFFCLLGFRTEIINKGNYTKQLIHYYKSGSLWSISRHEKLRANKVSTKRIPVPALTKDHQQPPQFKEKGKNLIEHHLNRCRRLTRILTLPDTTSNRPLTTGPLTTCPRQLAP